MYCCMTAGVMYRYNTCSAVKSAFFYLLFISRIINTDHNLDCILIRDSLFSHLPPYLWSFQ